MTATGESVRKADRGEVVLGLVSVLAFVAFVLWLFWGPREAPRQTQQVWVGCCACAADHAGLPAVATTAGHAVVPLGPLPMLGAPRHTSPRAPAVVPAPRLGDIAPVTVPAPTWSTPAPAGAAVAVPFAGGEFACATGCGSGGDGFVRVPEPGSAGVMLFGLAAVGVAARRRRREGGQ